MTEDQVFETTIVSNKDKLVKALQTKGLSDQEIEQAVKDKINELTRNKASIIAKMRLAGDIARGKATKFKSKNKKKKSKKKSKQSRWSKLALNVKTFVTSTPKQVSKACTGTIAKVSSYKYNKMIRRAEKLLANKKLIAETPEDYARFKKLLDLSLAMKAYVLKPKTDQSQREVLLPYINRLNKNIFEMVQFAKNETRS